ncbi:MAG: hypothetical protein P4M08_09140 [Oligoflexia bacterium]|nr:hypothetical protein [Oligoflexia bacterium]
MLQSIFQRSLVVISLLGASFAQAGGPASCSATCSVNGQTISYTDSTQEEALGQILEQCSMVTGKYDPNAYLSNVDCGSNGDLQAVRVNLGE